MKRTASLLLLVLLSLPLSAQQLPKDLDATVARAMQTFEVPGLSIAVVRDGRVLLAKGYGVRKLGGPARVDADTIFGIASNTKAFTAASLALLVDEGKLSWDDRVIDHLPSFQMYDPYVTRELTVRDLLVHRSGLGLGAGDLLWWPPSTYTKEEVVARLRHVKPASSFRSRYAYDNVLYGVAGEVVEKVSGMPWDDFVRARIFAPLGMAQSNLSIAELLADDNAATPHMKLDSAVRPIPAIPVDNVKPAAAINSSANDLAKWMIAQLDRGAIRGSDRRLFSEEQSKEMWTPQVITPIREPKPSLAAFKPKFSAYASGWGIRDWRGELLAQHSGVLPGYFSRVVLVPEKKIGVAILVNHQSDAAHEALAYTLVDALLGAPKTDWITAFGAAAGESRAEGEEAVRRLEAARNRDSRPSLPLGSYAGTYRDPWYGDVTLSMEEGRLMLRFSKTPALVADLEHWQYDTFAARWRDRTLEADAFVTFALNPDGSIDTMKMRAISPLTDFSFDFHDLLLRRVP